MMHLKELKKKTPAELVGMAEELGVEGASTLRKQDLMFAVRRIWLFARARIQLFGWPR
jgi:transcription termination factor Rho